MSTETTGLFSVTQMYIEYPRHDDEPKVIAEQIAWSCLWDGLSKNTTIMDSRKYQFNITKKVHYREPKPPFESSFTVAAVLLLCHWWDAEIGEAFVGFDYPIPDGDTFHVTTNGRKFTRESKYWRRVE